ncbi:MAG: hypothetical protein NZ583_00880 [Desulfobacterota bacterium]|nr:hypothetical protein [Thermodesulfobacteriota bacterium]MDW8001269.1 hypothetical protein [Deltaproteobacteria bacterium]
MGIRAVDERCVWMTAGLVLYKLCDREYDCTSCPFDIAMRGGAEDLEKEEAPFFKIEFFNFYHPNHLWVRVENPSKVTVGIDSFLSSFLSSVRSIVFPNPGDRFVQGERFCHIVEGRGILPLPSPVSGVVISVNGSLKKKPELLLSDPLNEGFLVKMRPDNFEKDIKKLLSGKEALLWLKRDERRLYNFLLQLSQKERVGPTMQDGGSKRFVELLRELSKKDYLKLIETFL